MNLFFRLTSGAGMPSDEKNVRQDRCFAAVRLNCTYVEKVI